MKVFVRYMDNRGRVTVPMEMRESLNVKPGDPIDIERVQGGIILSPLNASCGICGSTVNLLEIDGMGICRRCAMRLRQKLEEKDAEGSQS